MRYWLTKNNTETGSHMVYLWRGTDPPTRQGNIWIGSKQCKCEGMYNSKKNKIDQIHVGGIHNFI